MKKECVLEAYGDAVDELYVSQEQGRRQTFSRAFRLVERYVQGPGKILDVGAAGGFFLKVAKDKGWEPYGVEPSCWMAEWGNRRFGVNIKPGVLCDAKFPNNFFDVITMWDVLEHTSDPLAELKESRRILKDGGIIVINFPDAGSWLARVAGSKWWFFLSVHLYYFTKAIMDRMLIRAGFTPLAFRPHFQSLDLEHLSKMAGLYCRPLSQAGLKTIRLMKIGHWQIPYYAAQTNVIARKSGG
ncbi:MAG: class I SAM-dependent methyltransferase [Verrucomicrobiota bacterium]